MKRLLIVVTLVCVLSATALAGDMPGGGKSATGDMPGGSTTGQMSTVPVVGEMPSGASAITIETELSLLTTVLLTFITLIGR